MLIEKPEPFFAAQAHVLVAGVAVMLALLFFL
jgi:hypothetical protein